MTESPSNENQPKERYYIGRNKPKVEYPIDPPDWPGKLYKEEEIMSEGDYLPIDMQGYDIFKEGDDR